MTDHTILEEKDYGHMVSYRVEIEVNGEKHQKGFNIEPEQDIQSFIDRWHHNLKAEKR